MTSALKTRASQPLHYLSDADVVSCWGESSGWSSAVMTMPMRTKWFGEPIVNAWPASYPMHVGGYPFRPPTLEWTFPRATWTSPWQWQEQPRILRSDDRLLLISPDYGSGMEWLDPALGALNNLFRIEAGDDLHHPPDLDYVIEALQFLARVLPASGAAPAFSSLNDGGVQIEWHRGGLDVEVVFSGDPDEQGIYVRDKTSGEERELPLSREAFVEAVGGRLSTK